MIRLTTHNKFTGREILRTDLPNYAEYDPIIRLAAYEDTGLDPWEIRRLKEQDELDRKTLLNFDCLGVDDLATRYCLARSERDSLKAERDAAIADMYGHCSRCKYFRGASGAEKCATCVNTVGTDHNWEWRGPQQEET